MILDVSVYDKQAERLFQSRTHLLCARTHKDRVVQKPPNRTSAQEKPNPKGENKRLGDPSTPPRLEPQ